MNNHSSSFQFISFNVDSKKEEGREKKTKELTKRSPRTEEVKEAWITDIDLDRTS